MAEFWNQSGKSDVSNSRSYAAVVNVPGISEVGLEAASGSVLNEVATSIRNGAMYRTARAASRP